jgi:hypothetical protein
MKTPTSHRPRPRVPWQRLLISLLGVLVVALQWRWATNHLYTLPPAALPTFLSINNNTCYVIGAIVIFMVTGKLIYELKNGGG